MADWALSSCERVETLGPTDCTYGGSATKGTWVQMTAATSFSYDAISFELTSNPGDGGGDSFLVDIAIGSAGSEIVIVPNLLLDLNRVGQTGALLHVTVPVSIPAGARIAVRCQTGLGAGTRRAHMLVVGRAGGANYAKSSAGGITAYGADTTNTDGLLIDQGSVANTWGAWVQATASTSSDHNALFILGGFNKQTSGMTGPDIYRIQVASGASGSETILFETHMAGSTSTNISGASPIFSIAVPSGTRLAIRSQTNFVAAIDRHLTAVLYGF